MNVLPALLDLLLFHGFLQFNLIPIKDIVWIPISSSFCNLVHVHLVGLCLQIELLFGGPQLNPCIILILFKVLL